MGNYRIVIKKSAQKDLKKHKKSGNKKNLSKISKIIDQLKFNPYSGTGKPEALKYELAGLWSRRINKKDRLVYIVSAMGHYDDK